MHFSPMRLADDENASPAFWHVLSLLIKAPVMEPVSIAHRLRLSPWLINPTHDCGRLLTRTQITSSSPTNLRSPTDHSQRKWKEQRHRGPLGALHPPTIHHPPRCSETPTCLQPSPSCCHLCSAFKRDLMSDQRVELSPKVAALTSRGGASLRAVVSVGLALTWGNSSAEAA